MMEHWTMNGYSFVKRVYLSRPGDKKIHLGSRMVRAALELCFSSNIRSHHIRLNEEEFKPMVVKRSRRRRCSVCTGEIKRNETVCEKCAALPKESQQVVKGIDPVVIIKVDTRWRWITGSISLNMYG
jgi:hypothetical protein